MARAVATFLISLSSFLFFIHLSVFAGDPFSLSPLKFMSGKNFVVIAGKLDPVKHPDFAQFKVAIEYSPSAPYTTDPLKTPPDSKPIQAVKKPEKQAPFGVGEGGAYYFHIGNLTPNTKYYYRQVVESPSGEKQYFPAVFNSSKGEIFETKESVANDFERRSYRLLAPLPGLSVLLDPSLCQEQIAAGKVSPDNPFCNKDDPGGFNGFLNYMFTILIGLSAVLLVLRIIFEGYQYIVTDVPFLKSSAKSKLMEGVFGLLLALTAYLILNTINPKLVENEIALEGITLEVENIEGDTIAGTIGYRSYISSGKPGNGVTGYDFSKATFPNGIICPAKNMGQGDIATIAKSFIGKITYAQLEPPPKGPRGTPAPNGYFFLDCSSYVTTVLKCAGINPPAYAVTTQLFLNAEPTTTERVLVQNGIGYINGIALKPGDLLGWKDTDRVSCKKGGGCSGHVVMYIGGGQVIDSHGGKGRNPGQSVTGPFSLEYYKKQIRWVKRI